MAEPTATYRCETCGTEFTEPDEGGSCILCLQPYCNAHLGKRPAESDVGALCASCAGGSG